MAPATGHERDPVPLLTPAGGRHCTLTLWTDDPRLAARADRAGVDRIGPDFECLDKERRQAGLGYRISRHRRSSLPALRAAVSRGSLFARTDPLNEGSAEEVELLLDAGVEVLMLPMFRTVAEVEHFAAHVAGRARIVALLEHVDAVAQLGAILAAGVVDEVHVGLNDLALSLGVANRFALLVDPLMEEVAGAVHAAGLPFGAGGLGRVGDTALPIAPDLIYAQHARLGATAAIVARSFLGEGIDLAAEIRLARERLAHWQHAAPAALAAPTARLRALTHRVTL